MVSIYICDDDKIFRQKLYDNLKEKCEKIGIDYTLSLISTFEELKENLETETIKSAMFT